MAAERPSRKSVLLRRAARKQYRLEGRFVSRDYVIEKLQKTGLVPITELYAVTPELWADTRPPPYRRRKNPNRVRAAREREERKREARAKEMH